MRRLLAVLMYCLVVISCHARDHTASPAATHQPEAKADSVYFSIESLCNFKVQFTGADSAKATFNGKVHTGTIQKNKNSTGFFDFVEAGKMLFMFSFEDDALLIVNQQYQFTCEAAKVIELQKLISDEAVKQRFAEYMAERPDEWHNIEALNNKAFYLAEVKYYATSVYILRQVLQKDPNRAVAWLNLADSLWELGNRDEARKSYNKYIMLIKNQKKDEKKIPKRVFART
ncbi:MAG TPA: tetratricopeptide repeat protein [Flavobacterium sp.]|jgi:tetratricopeptide (TPR) repeat protein